MNYNTVSESCINGRNVCHYSMETPICNLHIITEEMEDKTLKRYFFDELGKAVKKYKSIVKALLVK